MSIEAMKMALDALEKLWDIIDDIDTYSDMAKADDKLYRSLVERRQSNRFKETGISTDGYTLDGGAIAALRQAIEQAEKPEPVAYPEGDIVGPCICGSWPGGKCLKCPRIALPKREWVGLTDEEIEECKINGGLPHAINWRLSVKVMEAKLREKNG
jgi:hypothetical protein